MENYYGPAIFLSVIVLLILLTRPKKQKHSRGDVEMTIQSVTFKSNPTLSSTEDFIHYLKICATSDEIPFSEVKDYFIDNMESLKLGYVYQTKKPLIINNVQGMLKKAVKAYK